MTRTDAHLDAMLRHLGAASYESLRDYSKGCGLCAAECPCGAVEMEPESSCRSASRRGITGLGASPGAPVEWKASRAAPGVSK
jgi:ferredoxin